MKQEPRKHEPLKEDGASLAPAGAMQASPMQAGLAGGIPADGLYVHGLGKTIKRRPIVQGVSLSVQRGEVVGLLGPNGAGKTSCFYLITGLMPPDFGNIFLDGEDITQLPMYRRARLGLGYLPQEASVFRGLSVEDNLLAVAEMLLPDKPAQQARVEELLLEFGLAAIRKSPAMALSGGERRRVEIARALAASPQLLLLDEPLAGIDPIALNDVRALIGQLKQRGLGVLITDHNVRDTLALVDRAYILHEGRVLMQGRPEEIVANEDVRRVYLGADFKF